MDVLWAAVVEQFELMGALSANSSASISRSRDKLRALQLIGNSGVEMPVTGYVHLSRDIESVLKTVGEPPYVIKLLEGTQGRSCINRNYGSCNKCNRDYEKN